MSEPHIHRNLADKRKEIQAYIGSLERDLERARRDLSAIVATERVFQSKGSKVTAYMELAALFPRHALPDIVKAALATYPEGMATVDVANHIITAKNLRRQGPPLAPFSWLQGRASPETVGEGAEGRAPKKGGYCDCLAIQTLDFRHPTFLALFSEQNQRSPRIKFM